MIERTCKFCKANDGKIVELTSNLSEYIDQNCTCYKNLRIGLNLIVDYNYTKQI